jgi:hypothetical protein
MRILTLAAAATVSLTTLGTAPADAAAPQPVTLVVSTTFDDLADEVIAATGPLADDCATGTMDDTFFHAGPSDATWPTVSGSARLQVGKVLHCTSGDIELRLVVRLDLTTQTTAGRWVATGGTGAYARVSGSGVIVGTPFPDGIEDAYSGQIHGL